MEGFILLDKGYFKGFKQYYAILDGDNQIFLIRRKSYKGSLKLKLNLDINYYQ